MVLNTGDFNLFLFGTWLIFHSSWLCTTVLCSVQELSYNKALGLITLHPTLYTLKEHKPHLKGHREYLQKTAI